MGDGSTAVDGCAGWGDAPLLSWPLVTQTCGRSRAGMASREPEAPRPASALSPLDETCVGRLMRLLAMLAPSSLPQLLSASLRPASLYADDGTVTTVP